MRCGRYSGWEQESIEKLFGSAEGEKILRAFDGLLEAAKELLEVLAALNEIDV